MKSIRIAAIVTIVAAAGCANSDRNSAPAQTGGVATSRSGSSESGLANGRAIFQTGRDLQGKAIVAQPPPLLHSCAGCHRANGSGGVRLPGGAVSADLRPKALGAAQKHPYTLALIERAVTTGIDNEGQPLNRVMPHWQMSKQDVHDVSQYVLAGFK